MSTKSPFLQPFEDTVNGLYFNDILLPEEVVQIIFTYVPPKELLKLTPTCKKWCNIIKSEILWMHIYNRHHPKTAKKLPWYVYYCYLTTNNFHNMLKNGNGQERFRHWQIIMNGGDGFRIEHEPCGSDALPENVPEFNGHTSCFVTSFMDCCKLQKISLKNKRLLTYIMEKFRPHIYVSEWVAGRCDCGCYYSLDFKGYSDEINIPKKVRRTNLEMQCVEQMQCGKLLFYETQPLTVLESEGHAWEKVEILIKQYPLSLRTIVFQHMGRDTKFWKGFYGSKMTGGVVRFVWDSIEPLPVQSELEPEQLAHSSRM